MRQLSSRVVLILMLAVLITNLGLTWLDRPAVRALADQPGGFCELVQEYCYRDDGSGYWSYACWRTGEVPEFTCYGCPWSDCEPLY